MGGGCYLEYLDSLQRVEKGTSASHTFLSLLSCFKQLLPLPSEHIPRERAFKVAFEKQSTRLSWRVANRSRAINPGNPVAGCITPRAPLEQPSADVLVPRHLKRIHSKRIQEPRVRRDLSVSSFTTSTASFRVVPTPGRFPIKRTAHGC